MSQTCPSQTFERDHLPRWTRETRRAASEIVLQDRTIGVRLEVATRPSHRRFDDLVADHEHAVARAGIAEPVRRPFRRAEAFLVINRFRPRYQDAQRP